MHDVGAGLDGTGHDPQRIARTVALLREGGLGNALGEALAN